MDIMRGNNLKKQFIDSDLRPLQLRSLSPRHWFLLGKIKKDLDTLFNVSEACNIILNQIIQTCDTFDGVLIVIYNKTPCLPPSLWKDHYVLWQKITTIEWQVRANNGNHVIPTGRHVIISCQVPARLHNVVVARVVTLMAFALILIWSIGAETCGMCTCCLYSYRFSLDMRLLTAFLSCEIFVYFLFIAQL